MTGRLLVKKLSPDAITPTRGSPQAAGLDLSSIKDYTIKAGGKELIDTGLVFKIPIGYYGRIAPRSGMSWKHHTDIGAGVIDSDYRGEVKVLLFNLSSSSVQIKKGDRVAQLILEKILIVDPIEVKDLDETVRGAGGFGSTGLESVVSTTANTTGCPVSEALSTPITISKLLPPKVVPK